MLVQHVVERKAGIVRVAQVATGALAEDHATDPVYHPRQAELLQHPIDPVGILVDVFEKQDRAVEGGKPVRAHQCRQDGEIAAKQAPPGGSLH